MTKLKLFIFICFCALSTITQAQQAPYTLQLSDVTFSNGKITAYTNTTEKNIIIPDNFNGVAVTSIGKDTFNGDQLTEVSIPNTVKSIGKLAFYKNKLTEVIIPNYVLTIGDDAFEKNKLTEVIIGNSVESIGKDAFYDNQLTEVIIPNSVKFIKVSAFAFNKLTEVIIGNSLTSIGDYAFYGNKLTEVSIPNSVNSIGYKAFFDNTGLTFNLPTHYQGYSYSWSNSKKSGDEITDFALSYVLDEGSKGDAVDFTITYNLDGGTNDANNPANYTIETDPIILADATKVGYTFVGWYSEAAFTNQVTEIAIGSTGDISLYAKYSDEYTLQLSDVDFSDGEITDYSNATEKNIIIPDNFNDVAVTSIGENAFQNNQLTQVSIPNSVNSIGKNAFSDNTGLTSFNLPAHYQGYSYSWSNGKKSGDEITDFALSYVLGEDSKGNAVDFTISYTLDGGTNAANNPANYTIETETITLAEASKDHYTFEGWYSDATFTADNEVTEIATGSTGPKEFFAKFSTYDITYNLDGGTNDANNPAKYTVKTETITLANASKTGRTFKGWYSEAAFTNQVTEIATGSTGDISLYAKYSDEYTLQLSDVIFSDEEITDYTNTTEKNIIIPDNFNDVAVTSIGYAAFYNNQLTQVSIGNSVNSIGYDAFYDNQLTQVSIGNSVLTIGDGAFWKNKLTEVIIPNSVKFIEASAFSNNQLTNVIIGNSVTSIGKNAFNNNTGLTLFNLPTHYQGYSYSWSNGKKSGDEITDFTLSYELDEDSKGDAVDFTISYTLDGGTNDANNPANYTIETGPITLADATKVGYTFAGWYSEDVFTNQVTEITTGSTGDISLYAKYSDEYTLQLSDVIFSNGEITDYTNATEKNIIIPENFNDVAVTFIGEDAFQNNQLTQVSIPSSVTSIGEGAFSDNTGLTSFNLPAHYQGSSYSWSNGKKSGDEITDFALSYELDEDSKGDAVGFTITYTLDGGTNAANNPADYTVETATITLENASKDRYTFAGWYSEAAFTNQVTEIAIGSTEDVVLFAKFLETYNISYTLDGGTNDANNPAAYTVESATITLADASKTGRTFKGWYFKGWYSKAAFTNQVTEIATGSAGDIRLYAKYSDEYTLQLSDVTFSNGEITDYTNTTEKNIIIPDNFNDVAVTSIGEGAFQNNKLTQVSIPDFVTYIGEDAFSSNKLTQVSIPNSVNSIGKNAFQNNQLTQVSIGNSVKIIGDGAFQNNKLTQVSIPDFVTYIGYYAFSSNQLIKVSIGNSVTTIEDGAFFESKLTEVIIPNSVNSIGVEAFYGNKLTEVSIGNSVTFIGDGAFRFNDLTNVSIPTSVITIGDRAFHTNKLTEVSIPNSVTSIGDGAFSSNKLTEVSIPSSVNSIGKNAFKDNTGLTSFNLPALYQGSSYPWSNGKKSGDEITDFALSYVLDEDSKDDAVDFTIIYNLNGGTNAANNPADYTVETATITLADATKDGYTFEGWYSDAAFTNQVTEIATGSTGDVVLFAKYSEIALGIYTTNIKVFNVYPNPSIDFIQTELEVSSLTIRSISGSKVKQFEGGSFFDISNLKSGVYILLAIDKNGDTYKSKLLKE